MTPLEMIAEWRKGCTCGGPVFDQIENNPPGTTSPAECIECTVALIEAIESWHQRARGPWYIRAPMAVLSWILERMPRPATSKGFHRGGFVNLKPGDSMPAMLTGEYLVPKDSPSARAIEERRNKLRSGPGGNFTVNIAFKPN